MTGMKDLVRRLGELPLALVQAGRYMHETGTSCPTYLRLYETSWPALQADISCLRDYPNGSIQTTWTISYKHIQKHEPRAAKLLHLWAYLDRQDLWFELLNSKSFNPSKDPSWFQDVVKNETSFKSIIKMLLNYSLIDVLENTESYSMHPVVHDWCKESISKHNDELVVLAVIVVGRAAPRQSGPGNWLLQRRLFPHAKQCLRHLSDLDMMKVNRREDCINAFHRLCGTYENQGKLGEAEEMYKQALVAYENAMGSDDEGAFLVLNNLACLYSRQERLEDAEKMFLRALDGFERVVGAENVRALDTMGNLAGLYRDQGKLAEAEEMYKSALRGKERSCGPEHFSTLMTVNGLGIVYKKQGKKTEAEHMYQRALTGYEKDWGGRDIWSNEHFELLETIHNLAILYREQGRMAEAEPMYKRSMREAEKVYGSEHPSTLEGASGLAVFYAAQGEFLKAEELYMQALQGFEKIYGPTHMKTLDVFHNLAVLYYDHGRKAEAEELYQLSKGRK